MEIVSKTEGNKVTMEIGWFDTQTSPQLGEELYDDSVTSLVFDFAKLEYISSAGLLVISAYKKWQRWLQNYKLPMKYLMYLDLLGLIRRYRLKNKNVLQSGGRFPRKIYRK